MKAPGSAADDLSVCPMAIGYGSAAHLGLLLSLLLHAFPAKKDKVRLQQAATKAVTILPFDGVARSKQDPINRGHGAQYLYRPPPAGAHNNNNNPK